MNNKSASTFLCLLVTVFALLAPSRALAQIGGTGSIQGVITDATGAVLPGATVTATNIATGVKTTRQTTSAGFYVLAPLPPGEYTISVSAQGFQPLVQKKVVVDALSTVGLNLSLTVGATTETVTVTSAPAQLNTSDARLGTTMRNEVYTALPLSMGVSGIGAGPRNPGAFIYLMPGVQEGNRWGTINGAQGFSKDVFVEGVPITDPIQQGEGRAINLGVSVDAIEQFQVETSGTGVEFNGQGAENYIIKSGGNEFHGSVFEFFRNTVLDARPFFAPKRPKENQNEFGGAIGGPIVKNKAFFFFTYDGWRYRVETDARLVTVPTLKMRQGDFSELPVTIYDPATTVALPGGGFTRQPFPGNIIPANRISPISNAYQAPLPNPTGSGIQNNYLGQLPVGYNNNNYTAKVDINLSDAHRLSTLFTRGKRGQSGPYREVTTPLPLPFTNTRIVEEIPTVAQVKHTWTISPRLLNQASFGFNRLYVPIQNATEDGKWGDKVGIKGLPPGEARDAFLEASFAGPNAPTGWRGVDSRNFLDANNSFTIQDSLQWIHGSHSFKFGVQHQRLQDNYRARATGTNFTTSFSNTQTAGFNAAGTLQTSTGHAYASYLLGLVNSATVNDDSVTTVGARYRNWAFWVQDDYKLTPKLTLNLGLRYDILLPYHEVANRMSYLNPDAPNAAADGRPGALFFTGDYSPNANSCHCETPIKTYYGAIGPRLGVAYNLNDKTVLRAAYGMMYTRRGAVGGREGGRDGMGTLGFNASAPLSNPNNGISAAFNWQDGIPAYQKGPIFDPTYLTGFNGVSAVGGTLIYGDPESQPPRYQNWNLSVQRSITKELLVTVAYVGSNGKYLAGAGRGAWSNQIQPRYLALGNLLNAQATAANIAAAQAIIPDVKLPFPSFRGTISQMLRPFPQYAGISDVYGNVGQSNYNALQVIAQQRLAAGLTFAFNYTFSKSINNVSGGRTAYDWEREKTLSNTDQPHLLNATFVYELPFGRTGAPGSGNRVLSGLLRDWKLSGITRYASGTPFGVIAAACNLPNAGTCFANYNPNFSGPVRINGDWGDGDLLGSNPTSFVDRNAFVSPAAYTYGNTPPTHAHKLRVPSYFNQDLSIWRSIPLRESWRFEIGADAFNLFNNVRFGGINTNITSSAFGRITAQVNTPRVVQFKAKILF